MTRRTLHAVVAAILALTWSTPSAAEIPETAMEGPAAETMHAYLEALVPFGFHGTALVTLHGDIVLHQAYGIADPTTRRPNTTATMFSTGSVTKQFTATAIMKLASDGRLAVEDPLSKYIAGVPAEKEAITLHHLLTHTAGLHPSYGPDEESIPRDDMVRRILDEPLLTPPGETYEYSNAGYTLLAVIVEELTGMPYENYLRETLYLPNGMTSTGLTSFDIDPSRVARSHNQDQGYRSPADRPADAWNLYGNGGQLSTTGDMYRWVRALQQDRLVPREAREKMFTRYAAEGPEGQCHYGYGWSICNTRRGGDVIWHNGGSMGLWSCAVYQYVDDDALFIVFTNSTIDQRSPVDQICVNLSRILFDEPFDMPPDLSVAARVDASAHTGTYDLDGGGRIVVTTTEGGVSVAPAGQYAMMSVFPSPMDDMLPGYNQKTREMIEAVRDGNFESAGEDVEMELNSVRTGAQWLRDWWESIEDAETLRDIDVVGTRFGEGAETYVRLGFADGPRDFCFYWMMGRCVGLNETSLPARTMVAVSPGRFTGFSMDGSVGLEFGADGTVKLETPHGKVEGRRRG